MSLITAVALAAASSNALPAQEAQVPAPVITAPAADQNETVSEEVLPEDETLAPEETAEPEAEPTTPPWWIKPKPVIKQPHINFLGYTLTLDGVQAGVAIKGNGVQNFAGGIVTLTGDDTFQGQFVSRALTSTFNEWVTIGDRFIGNRLDTEPLVVRGGRLISTFTPGTDVTSFRARDDGLFNSTSLVGYNFAPNAEAGKPIIALGIGDLGATAAVISDNGPINWSLRARGGINGLGARAEVSGPITRGVTGHAFIDSEDGAGARVAWENQVSKDFGVAAQISATTRRGFSASVEGNYKLNEKTTLFVGAEVENRLTFSVSASYTFQK